LKFTVDWGATTRYSGVLPGGSCGYRHAVEIDRTPLSSRGGWGATLAGVADDLLDYRIRLAMFSYLDRLVAQSSDGTVRSTDMNRFEFDGKPMRLLVQTGIWKPAQLEAALTIRTTYTPPTKQPPYADSIGPDGLVRYKYHGLDPSHSDNRSLRAAMHAEAELAYFVGVDRGVYVPRWPVWIVAEDRALHEFSVAVDAGLNMSHLGVDSAQRAYVARLVQERLHQPVFRSRVLRAYESTCAMCKLRHGDLLDAAHILPDGHPLGDPVVPNGLALCKIHHAAFDRNILGVRPDLLVEVQQRILDEIDGPMLRHGLQELHGQRLVVPRSRGSQPDPERLEYRYQEFRATAS
jgi:putative restriction endonuclease